MKPGLPSFTVEEKVHVGEELSDCLLYLIRLSDRCGVDLPLCAINKIEKNAQKYPEDKCKGSAKKYNEYERETKAEGDRHDGSHADAVDKGQHTERAGEKPSKKRTGAHDEGTNCDAKKQRHA